MSQRIASAVRRSWRTSTGTWYVAPPTRRLFTSTTGFLPWRMRLLTNFETSRSWNFGSGRILRFSTSRRRGIGPVPCADRERASPRLARALGAVLRAALLAALDAHGVQRPADDVVAHTRE